MYFKFYLTQDIPKLKVSSKFLIETFEQIVISISTIASITFPYIKNTNYCCVFIFVTNTIFNI